MDARADGGNLDWCILSVALYFLLLAAFFVYFFPAANVVREPFFFETNGQFVIITFISLQCKI